MFSERSAQDIINSHKQSIQEEKEEEMEARATTAFSTGIRIVSLPAC